MSRKGSLLSLRDHDPVTSRTVEAGSSQPSIAAGSAPSRKGKKAISGYFSPEMSFAMHMTARRHGLSLQDAMADAFNDWLRKMGESPVGE